MAQLRLLDLLGNDSRLVGWIGDDGRDLAARLADGVLEMTNVAAGDLEGTPPAMARRTGRRHVDAMWQTIQLDEVMIVVPSGLSGLVLLRQRERTTLRVGRFDVSGVPSVTDELEAPTAHPGGWVVVSRPRIRHLDRATVDLRPPAALLNPRRLA